MSLLTVPARPLMLVIAALLVGLALSMRLGAAEVFEPGTGWQSSPVSDTDVPPPDASPQVQLQHAATLFEAGKLERCADFCREMIDALHSGPEVEQAYVLLVRCQAGLGRLDEARRTVTGFHKRFPDSPYLNQMLDAELDIIERDVLAGRPSSVKTLQKIVDQNPYGPRSDRAQLLIGHYYLHKHDYLEARHAYDVLLTSYPKSDHADEARFGQAKAAFLSHQGPLRDASSLIEAKQIFTALVEGDPESRFTPEARNHLSRIDGLLAEHDFRIARYYEKQHKFNAAGLYYREVRRLYPETTWAARAADRLSVLNLPLEVPSPEVSHAP